MAQDPAVLTALSPAGTPAKVIIERLITRFAAAVSSKGITRDERDIIGTELQTIKTAMHHLQRALDNEHQEVAEAIERTKRDEQAKRSEALKQKEAEHQRELREKEEEVAELRRLVAEAAVFQEALRAFQALTLGPR